MSYNTTYTKENNIPITLQGQTAIVPTILKYFGLPKPESLDSSYIGDSNLDNNIFYFTSSFESSQKKSLKYPHQYLDYHILYKTVFSEKDTFDSFNGIGPETAKQISGAMTAEDYYVFFLSDSNTLLYNPKENEFVYGGRTESEGLDSQPLAIGQTAEEFRGMARSSNILLLLLLIRDTSISLFQ